MATPAPKHATVLVYYQDPSNSNYEIFIGQESTYAVNPQSPSGSTMFDRPTPDTNAAILSNPILVANPSYTFVRRTHTRNDGTISRKYTIQYATAASKWGVPKGGKTAADTSTLETAKREFWEEVGYNLETAKFGAPVVITAVFKGKPAYSHLFMMQVDATEKEKILEAYANKMCTRNGELHAASFMNFTAAKPLTLNEFTKDAFKKFAAAKGLVYPGGGGRRRTSRTRKTQRK